MRKLFPAALVAALTLTACGGGHEYVDLGITDANGNTIYWATTNVGAETPEAYGDYFAWAETTPKENYEWSTLKNCTPSDDKPQFAKYVTKSDFGTVDELETLEAADDVAATQWGGKWRMPTEEEIVKLMKQCYWQWVTSYNGKEVNGYVVYKAKEDADKGVKVCNGDTPLATYSLSDAHIFLPVAGSYHKSEINNAGEFGNYWTASIFGTFSEEAYILYLLPRNVDKRGAKRFVGHSVRPVCTK